MDIKENYLKTKGLFCTNMTFFFQRFHKCYDLFYSNVMKRTFIFSNFHRNMWARWPSDSAFDWRSRGPKFESCAGLTWIISLGTENQSPSFQSTKVWSGTLRGLCLCKFDIAVRRNLAAHTTGNEIVYP